MTTISAPVPPESSTNRRWMWRSFTRSSPPPIGMMNPRGAFALSGAGHMPRDFPKWPDGPLRFPQTRPRPRSDVPPPYLATMAKHSFSGKGFAECANGCLKDQACAHNLWGMRGFPRRAALTQRDGGEYAARTGYPCRAGNKFFALCSDVGMSAAPHLVIAICPLPIGVRPQSSPVDYRKPWLNWRLFASAHFVQTPIRSRPGAISSETPIHLCAKNREARAAMSPDEFWP